MSFAFCAYRAFSHDVMMAILVFQNNEMAAMLVSKQILKTQARVKITPREKDETRRVSPFSRRVFFTLARVSLGLLSLRKNGDYS